MTSQGECACTISCIGLPGNERTYLFHRRAAQPHPNVEADHVHVRVNDNGPLHAKPIIRADQQNPRPSAAQCAYRWPADQRGCGGSSRTRRAAKSVFLGVARTCRDGPAGRLYGSLPSSEILAKKTRIFCIVVHRTGVRIVEDHLAQQRFGSVFPHIMAFIASVVAPATKGRAATPRLPVCDRVENDSIRGVMRDYTRA